MTTFTGMFEPQSLRALTHLEGWQHAYAETLNRVNPQAAQAIIDEIPQVTEWVNPTGKLDHSFVVMQKSPYMLTFGSPLPYAARRQFGFEGADSLGRVYHDEGAFYIDKAIAAASDTVENLYIDGTEKTLKDLTQW